jgi:hypothetical protein
MKLSGVPTSPTDGFLGLALVLGIAFTAVAQISVGGLTDDTVYTDTVTFTVGFEAGYTGSASLNGTDLPLNDPVTITDADYYELTLQAA